MSLHHVGRVILGLMAVPALALTSDAVYDRIEGQRYCLDHGLAATSPDLTTSMCHSVGIDAGPLPTRLRVVIGEAVDAVWEPAAGDVRRLWAGLG